MNDRRIVIYPSRLKLVRNIVGCFIFVLAGLYLIRTESGISFIFGLLAILFFGFGFLALGYKFLRPVPLLIVTEQGIVYKPSVSANNTLEWSEIAELCSYTTALTSARGIPIKSTFLGIIPRNTEAFLARLGSFERALGSISATMTPAPINIPQSAVVGSVEQLLFQIEKAFEDQIQNNHILVRAIR